MAALPFAVALLIGLLVGIERQKASPSRDSILGIRSFVMIALLGALAGWLDDKILSVITLVFALGLVATSYWATARRRDRALDLGLTTELAAGVVLLLGYGSHRSPLAAITISVIVTLLLLSKQKLHRLTKNIKPSELQAVILLILLGISVTSALPDRTVDPWSLVNPQRFGILVLTLATLEFAGYIAAKAFGHGVASWAIGFLGGLASSTAVTLSAAKSSQDHPKAWRIQAVSIIAATLASLLLLVTIVTITSSKLTGGLLLRISVVAVLAVAALVWCSRDSSPDRCQVELRSPIDLRNVLRLSVLLSAIFIAMGAIERTWGEQGTMGFAIFAGLFELHGVSLATASLHAQGALTVDAASSLITLAMIGSLLSKCALAWGYGTRSLAGFLTLLYGVMSALLIAFL